MMEDDYSVSSMLQEPLSFERKVKGTSRAKTNDINKETMHSIHLSSFGSKITIGGHLFCPRNSLSQLVFNTFLQFHEFSCTGILWNTIYWSRNNTLCIQTSLSIKGKRHKIFRNQSSRNTVSLTSWLHWLQTRGISSRRRLRLETTGFIGFMDKYFCLVLDL